MDNGYFVYPNDKSCLLKSLNQIRNIYNRIDGEISKRIYINRLLYSMTLDLHYILNIILLTSTGIEFEHKLNEIGKKSIFVYGAGKRGRQLVELFADKNWKGYIDKRKRGNINDLEVKPFEEYSYLGDSTIIISNQSNYQEIEIELLNNGVCKDNIIVLEEWNKKAALKQYFEERCIQKDLIRDGFVDAGSFDGMDSIRFAEWTTNKNCKVWAFEPDNVQYEICRSNLSSLKSAKVYNIGLSYEAIREMMIMDHKGGSYIGNNMMADGAEIVTGTLDGLLLDENISYIKMDIEGYEEKALWGGVNIIRKQKPALAICVYHKRSDIFEIPSLLLKINPDYRFALGHYSLTQVDTVLYAF